MLGSKTENTTAKTDLSKFKPKFKKELVHKDININTSSKTIEKDIEKKNSKRQHVKIEYEASASKMNKVMPGDWETVLENLREMRKNFNAPVDSMGCDKCQDENAVPEVMRYQTLLALMLSSQTKDEITHGAMTRLRKHGCTVENVLNTSDEELGKLIIPVGFWKSKVKCIKKTSEILKNHYNCDIPRTVEELCKLPGVGPKMAHLCMKTAWGEITGIGVDTHVHRISNRLGWAHSRTPEDTRKILEGWLPFEFWSEVNHLLVGFGQQICQPLKPQCSICLNHNICPYGIKHKNGSKKRH
ncbi:hypothetical protein GWI33_020087 [Rhynchophorus ferrugineus]|uniref:Endonuclease III homolog n=1 Tax=Rhynchophorus ferrugineus TaxID=354439 RepID=A0A834M6A2_RHYFE|nr:hypothetical protein GWI33_020087 [Rhynchophorus ferrugineus]